MKRKDRILTWGERCEVHPAHQMGMITHQMIKDRMQEEIDDLREYIKKQAKEISIMRRVLKKIAEPYDERWYKSSHDADDVVDAMIAMSRVALNKAGVER